MAHAKANVIQANKNYNAAAVGSTEKAAAKEDFYEAAQLLKDAGQRVEITQEQLKNVHNTPIDQTPINQKVLADTNAAKQIDATNALNAEMVYNAGLKKLPKEIVGNVAINESNQRVQGLRADSNTALAQVSPEIPTQVQQPTQAEIQAAKQFNSTFMDSFNSIQNLSLIHI